METITLQSPSVEFMRLDITDNTKALYLAAHAYESEHPATEKQMDIIARRAEHDSHQLAAA